MDVSAQTVDHAAGIAVGLHVSGDLVLADHFEPGVTVFLPVRLVSRHLADLLVRERRKEATLHETAVDLVCRDPVADDLAALERHGSELHRLVGAIPPGDRLQVAAVAVDDLAAVATGRAETDPLCLQHDDRISPLA